ncbi:MAG: hypothetical protein HKO53_13085 [Gemmatimonadetes bacterium]|nr:hypothetical protein [Gemmatimonadota bacterium]
MVLIASVVVIFAPEALVEAGPCPLALPTQDYQNQGARAKFPLAMHDSRTDVCTTHEPQCA